MRIHFFVRSLSATGGGAHQNAIAMIRALTARDHIVTVHAFAGEHNTPPTDLSLIEHKQHALGFLKDQHALRDLLKQHEQEADVYLLYGVDFTWGAGRYKKLGGKTPVAVYLDTYLPTMRQSGEVCFMYYLKRLVWEKFVGITLARFVDRFLAVSPFVTDQYVQAGFPKDHFAIIPNFIELSSAVLPRQSHADVRLLYAGRITHDKGIDLLISAFAHAQITASWHLDIVGAGPLEATCKALIKKYTLDAKITMHAWMDAQTLAQRYASADVFVHPARWPEPFGRTLVEALHAGLPIVAPTKGAAPWIGGDAGIYFENNNQTALQTVLEKIINDSALRTNLAAKAPARAKVFNLEVVTHELETTLAQMSSSR